MVGREFIRAGATHLPPDVSFKDFPLVRPLSRVSHEPSSDRIRCHVTSFLLGALMAADSVMERTSLPTMIRGLMNKGKTRFPDFDPHIKTKSSRARPGEKVQMVWHQKVTADHPISGIQPSRS